MTTEKKLGKNEYNDLIERFVKPEKRNSRGFWPKEIKLAKQLIDLHTYEVLNNIVLGYHLNSLAFFWTEKGIEEIEKNRKIVSALKSKKSVDIFDKTEYVRLTERKPTFKERLLS
jgi:hypothetical protein